MYPAGTNTGMLLWGNTDVKKRQRTSMNDDDGKKPEGNKSTCCPKAFDGKKCVPEGLMKCPSGWGCQGYGKDTQCRDKDYGILTCGGGAVSSTDGKNKGATGGCTIAGTNTGMLLWGNTSVNACKRDKGLELPECG